MKSHDHKDGFLDAIYIQTNKDIYETGEDLWFKVYVLDAQYLSPSNRSKTLFVQLIDDSTNIAVWQEKHEIENGFVDGHILLDDSLQNGIYTLIGYSSHSFSTNTKVYHANRKIQILQNITTKTNREKIKIDSTLQFDIYPEGGYLVDGIQSMVGFKAVNSDGLPIQISGILYEENKPLLTFSSEHAGMGSFIFTPSIIKKYYIELLAPKQRQKYTLPEILPTGKVLQLISKTEKEVVFKVSKKNTSIPEKIYLRIQMRGNVYSIARGKLKDEIIIKIPLKELPQGIAQVTLFNTKLQPIAERLVYVKPNQKLHITATTNKELYKTREKVNLKIKVTDQNGNPVVAHLGLSVFDKLYKNEHGAKTIESHYHLSKQLKGRLYNPNYYFDSNNKNRVRALDLLLLTQGWRRYLRAKKNIDLAQGAVSRRIVSDTLKGLLNLRMQSKTKKDKEIKKVLMVFSANKDNGLNIMVVDSAGIFSIHDKHLKVAENAYLYIQLMNDPTRKLKLTLKDARFEKINDWRQIKPLSYPFFENFTTEPIFTRPFAESSNINKLDEVTLTAKKPKAFRSKYLGRIDSIASLKTPNFFNDDYVCEHNILNCINHPRGFLGNGLPTVGMEVKVRTANNRYAPMRTIVYGYEDENKKYHNYTADELLKKYRLVMLKGFYGKREFYRPTYDTITINDPFPDTRNTLLWKPNVITNKAGEVSLDFFTSDINTIFHGNIEGVNNKGLLGTKSFRFVVKKTENN